MTEDSLLGNACSWKQDGDIIFAFKSIRYTLGADRNREVEVSGQVAGGGVLAVRGPSGAGKTTLLRTLARLQPCAGGEAFLKGKSWQTTPGPQWRAGVHYLAQKPVIFDGTVSDNLAKPFETRLLSSKKFDKDSALQVMEQLLLAPGLWEQDARTLSGGETSRLAFARALLIDPPVLLLDEPTAALDGKSREAFYRLLSGWLNSPGRAALLVSHNDDFQLLSKVSFLDIEAKHREG
ncbi:MAG: ABC transporter [Peptococcaceae bacterium BICA1-7]|nr:MAG: ABC transporter [Peptococcaceae bacterium BICA1-7]HBV97184.1 ABC transporter [Desulfotomaculum sp.]